jgi:hypothetical protein
MKTAFVRIMLALCICVSLSIMYYVDVITRSFDVITNPDGPDISVRE